MKELILGGTRSGKSALAERMAMESGLPVTYVATARPGEDPEMRERVLHHQQRRPGHWGLVEVGADLASELVRRDRPDHCLLVDCLTLWLTHLLWNEDEDTCRREQQRFLEVLPGLSGRLIMVSNETSMGIIPMGELTRRFCDDAGRLHQAVAAVCDRVVLSVAGLPLILKGDMS